MKKQVETVFRRKIHRLKTWPEYFRACTIPDPTKRKMVEIRKNDRGFAVGDILILHAWDPREETFTGWKAAFMITHILPGGQWGLDPDVVALSIVPAQRKLSNRYEDAAWEQTWEINVWRSMMDPDLAEEVDLDGSGQGSPTGAETGEEEKGAETFPAYTNQDETTETDTETE